MGEAKKPRLGGAVEGWGLVGAAAATYVVLLVLHLGIQPYADDLWYIDKVGQWEFWPLQLEYYLTWSGRVVSSFFAFFLFDGLFWLWKFLNPAFFVLLVWGMARLALGRATARAYGLALLLLSLLGPGVLDYSVFWATGSVYYLWPTAAAVWLLAPLFDLLRTGEAKLNLYPARLLLAALCCLCNEQITACILGFMLVIFGWHALKTRRFFWRHWGLVLAAAAAAVVLYASPGSQERYLQESYLYYLQHYIGFYEVPLWEKVTKGLTWMFGMMTELIYLPLALLFGLCWHGRYQNAKGRLRLPLFGLLALAVAFAFPVPVDAMLSFRGFEDLFAGSAAEAAVGLAPYLFWGVFLLGILYLLARRGWVYAISFLAALCTLVVLFFSPTIYVSGYRTLLVAGVILIALMLRITGGRLPPLWVLFLGGLSAVSLARLLSRLLLFYGAAG